MFLYRSRFLTRGEVWFEDQQNGARVDWIYHRQRPSPLPHCRSRTFYTRLIDLQKEPAELLAEMDEKTARRITKAQEEDGLRCECCDANDSARLDEVEEMWNRFAVPQRTPLLERDWLEPMRKAGALDLVAAKDPAGRVLAYHLVFLTTNRARQLIAISPYQAVASVAWRAAVSRANSLIHWHNFQAFRRRGIRFFDFGGWYPGSTDIRLLGINSFKQGFGGRVIRDYECEQPITVKGQVVLAVAQLVNRLKQFRSHAGTQSKGEHNAAEPKEQQVPAALR